MNASKCQTWTMLCVSSAARTQLHFADCLQEAEAAANSWCRKVSVCCPRCSAQQSAERSPGTCRTNLQAQYAPQGRSYGNALVAMNLEGLSMRLTLAMKVLVLGDQCMGHLPPQTRMIPFYGVLTETGSGSRSMGYRPEIPTAMMSPGCPSRMIWPMLAPQQEIAQWLHKSSGVSTPDGFEVPSCKVAGMSRFQVQKKSTWCCLEDTYVQVQYG